MFLNLVVYVITKNSMIFGHADFPFVFYGFKLLYLAVIHVCALIRRNFLESQAE
jgi:hypothetical protein